MTILQRAAQVSANAEVATRAHEFCAIAKCLIAGRHLGEAEKFAEAARLGARVIDRLQTKSAVSAGTTGHATWGGPLADAGLISGFLDSLRAVGVFDRVAPDTIRVPLRTRIISTTANATAYISGNGNLKPISSLALATGTIEEQIAAAIVVISAELAKSASPESFALFRRELTAGVAAATDAEFLRIVTTGVTSVATSGSTAAGARQDVRTLLSLVATGSNSALYLIVTPAIGKALSIISDPSGSTAFPTMGWSGGTIAGITVLASDSVPSGQMILLNAGAIATGASDVKIDTSQTTSLQMDTNPDSPATTSTVNISLFQSDLVAIRAERFFGAELLRTDGAAYVTGISYAGNSPA